MASAPVDHGRDKREGGGRGYHKPLYWSQHVGVPDTAPFAAAACWPSRWMLNGFPEFGQRCRPIHVSDSPMKPLLDASKSYGSYPSADDSDPLNDDVQSQCTSTDPPTLTT